MPDDRHIRIGAINTRYWQAGDSGSTVLLLHGLGCSVLEWQHNIAPLAARHRVFAPDLMGFGLSDKPADETYTLPRLARFVLDFMTELKIDRAHIAGNSMGGRIALDCAHQARERVASLLLADPAGIERRSTLLEFRLATVPGLGELFTRPNRPGIRMLWQKAFARPAPIVTDDFVATKIALAKQPGAQAAFLKSLRSFVDIGGFTPQPVAELHAALPQISAPTLVIWGSEDRFVPPAHAELLGRLLPNAEVQMWEQCGHAPQIEEAQRFNATALAFWERLDAGNA